MMNKMTNTYTRQRIVKCIHTCVSFLTEKEYPDVSLPFSGRKIAIDASMCIYQFLIAVRQEGNVLTNAEGEVTR